MLPEVGRRLFIPVLPEGRGIHRRVPHHPDGLQAAHPLPGKIGVASLPVVFSLGADPAAQAVLLPGALCQPQVPILPEKGLRPAVLPLPHGLPHVPHHADRLQRRRLLRLQPPGLPQLTLGPQPGGKARRAQAGALQGRAEVAVDAMIFLRLGKARPPALFRHLPTDAKGREPRLPLRREQPPAFVLALICKPVAQLFPRRRHVARRRKGAVRLHIGAQQRIPALPAAPAQLLRPPHHPQGLQLRALPLRQLSPLVRHPHPVEPDSQPLTRLRHIVLGHPGGTVLGGILCKAPAH